MLIENTRLMHRIIVLISILCYASCSKEKIADDDIPVECIELGYNPNPVVIEKGFFINGEFNSIDLNFDYGGISFGDDENKRPYFRFGTYNSCNLQHLNIRYTNGFSIDNLGSTEIDPSFQAVYNYGNANELLLSQRYDSLVLNSDFENYLVFDFINTDTTILEGRFQIHLTKSRCCYFDDGSLKVCRTPDYFQAEPTDIKIRNGKFRISR